MYTMFDKIFRRDRVKDILIDECLQLNDSYIGIMSYGRREKIRRYYTKLTINELELEKKTLVELINLSRMEE